MNAVSVRTLRTLIKLKAFPLCRSRYFLIALSNYNIFCYFLAIYGAFSVFKEETKNVGIKIMHQILLLLFCQLLAFPCLIQEVISCFFNLVRFCYYWIQQQQQHEYNVHDYEYNSMSRSEFPLIPCEYKTE